MLYFHQAVHIVVIHRGMTELPAVSSCHILCKYLHPFSLVKRGYKKIPRNFKNDHFKVIQRAKLNQQIIKEKQELYLT